MGNRRIIVIHFLLLAVAAGVTMMVRRYGYKAVPDVPIIAEIKQIEDSTYPYSIGFVQFDDEGRFRRRSQLANILSRIQSDAQHTGAVIAMFVHGWNNTCNECSEEVQCFERQLAFISQLQSLYQPARKVFGVYIGWKGVRLAPPEYNTALTFGDRRDVADRIGARGDLRETIEKLGALRKSLDRPSVFIVSGHSLGARAVFKAMTADVNEEGHTLPALERFSDLLLLFNPALSASDYLAVDREAAVRARTSQPTSTRPEPPKMLVLGSESDYVTQMIYPFSVDRRWLVKLSKDDHLERFTTVGNFSSFYTHRLTLTEGEPEVPSRPGTSGTCACTAIQPETFRALVEARKARTSSTDSLYAYTDIDMPGGVRNTKYHVKLVSLGVERGPYAVVQVDRRLMNGHGGIYTPALAEFLTRVANQRFFRQVTQ